MCSKIFTAVFLSFTVCVIHLTTYADSSNTPVSPDISSRNQEQSQKDIQNQAQQAQDEVQKTLVPEAIFIVDETKKAINFIKNGQNAEALSAIESATGKSDILIARHPEGALLPVDFSIKVSDAAPDDFNKINDIEKQIKKTFNARNYPASRALLNSLSSEICIDIYCLPLAYYPKALKEAARFLELKQPSKASLRLQAALDTFVIMHQIFPIPTIEALTLLTSAEEVLEKENNKETALKLVNEAKIELKRSVELGYLEKNGEYAALNEKFVELENKIKKDQKATQHFSSLKEKLKAFLKTFSKPNTVSHYSNEELVIMKKI